MWKGYTKRQERCVPPFWRQGRYWQDAVRPPLEGLPYLNLESGWYAYFLRLIALGAAIVTVFHLPFLVRERRGKKEREAAR